MSLAGGILRSRAASSLARSAARSSRRALLVPAEELGGLGDRLAEVEDRPVLPVAVLGHVVDVGEFLGALGAEDFDDLGEGPDVEFALFALGVGVLGRVERPLGAGHPAEDVVHRLAGDAGVFWVVRDLVGFEVDGAQQGIVVEHLLEVRGQPALVGRVAGEAAAEVVVDPPSGHLVEGVRDHVERVRVAGPGVLAEQDAEVHRVRELGGVAEPAVDRLVGPAEAPDGVVEDLGVQLPLGLRDHPGGPELAGHVGRGGDDLVAPLLPGPLDAQEDPGEAGHSPGVDRRVIRPAVEWFEVGREEDRHRPAALAGHRLDGRHVEVIEVGPLLAVDLDVDVPLVHQRRDVRVLEALPLHDVAPVAGRVADREEDRPVLRLRLRQRLRAPGEPVDRVVGVLEQVRAGLPGESVRGMALGIGHGSLGSSRVRVIGEDSPSIACNRRTCHPAARGSPGEAEPGPLANFRG